MEIHGYQVLRERGPWVDEKALYDPPRFMEVVERLHHLAQYPDHPTYLQVSPLNKFRRIRMDHYRLYARILPASRILCILSFNRDREIKRNELAGSLRYDFIEYILKHEEFLADRFIPFEEPQEKPLPIPQQEPQKEVSWNLPLRWKTLSEEEAKAILMELPGAKRPNPEREMVLEELLRRPSGDKILIPINTDGSAPDRTVIDGMKKKVAWAMKQMDVKYSVRYDAIAQKIVLVPPDRIDVYWAGRSYKRPQIAERGLH